MKCNLCSFYLFYKTYTEKPLLYIMSRVFRHTFCPNMANAGMDIKNLQYVMGYSDVGVVLNVYTHAMSYCLLTRIWTLKYMR